MKKLCLILLISIIAIMSVLSTSNGVAFADTVVYSDVLDDLSKDEFFDKSSYVINQTDYSLSIIQVAEGNDKSLLVYVYQPSAGKYDILAKKIRMSVNDGFSYEDYDLTLLSRNTCFYKYKVDNYVADYTSTTVRTYKTTALFREAKEELGDTVVDKNNNTISYVSYSCPWTFYTTVNSDGKTIFGKEKDKTITVTDKYCGQLLFENAGNDLTAGLLGSVEYGMLHFIAFNADITIDELYKADVAYTINVYEDYLNQVLGITQENYKDKVLSETRYNKTLNCETEGMYQGDFLSHKYTWKEIMSREDFVNNVCTASSAFFDSKLTEKGSEEINNKQWVLVLCSTTITQISRSTGVGNYESRYTRSCLTDETILRLEGKSQGEVFNLGVVDNYQAGDGVPDNEEKYAVNWDYIGQWFEQFEDWFKIIGIILAGVLLVVLCMFLFPYISKLVKFILKVIIAPFRLLFSKNKKGGKYGT